MIEGVGQNKKRVLGTFFCALILGSLFLTAFFILESLVSSQPFGHDESVYLTKARSWMEDTPADQFVIYRPIGMVGAGWAFLQFSYEEQAVRMFGVIFGAATILVVYLFFRRMFHAWIGVSVAAVVGLSSLFLREAPQFFNDIPSSGLLLATLWVIYIHYESGGKSKSIYLAPFFAALAFYLRYGVASTIAIIGIVSTVLLAPSFIKKENVRYDHVRNAILLSFLLFIPHFVYSLIKMDSFLGILLLSGEAAGREYLGEGLVQYGRWLSSEIGGWVLGSTAIAGIAATIVVLLRKDLRQKYINLLWIGSIGLVTLIIMGLLVHAEARYVFFPMVLLSGAGVVGVYYLIRTRSPILAALFLGVFLAGALFQGAENYNGINAFYTERENVPSTIAYNEALKAISKDSNSMSKEGCALWLVLYRPNASWYSRCNMLPITDVAAFEKYFRSHASKAHYSLVYTNLDEPQITQEESERFGVALTEVFRVEDLPLGDLVVYRITKTEFKTSEEREQERGRNWFLPLRE